MTNHNNEKPSVPEKSEKLKKILIPAATILFGILITVVLFIYRDKVQGLGNYGYLGAFLVSLITRATVVLPVPGIVVLFALGATLNPVLVGLVAAFGSIIGEMTGFIIGFGGSEAIPKKNKVYLRLEGWMKRWGSWTVFVVAAVPLPLFDVVGLISGALRFPVWKFFLAGWAGKSIKMVVLVVAGAWGWQTIIHWFT
jgi:membrane protein YqaA with SNARE-associated domain